MNRAISMFIYMVGGTDCILFRPELPQLKEKRKEVHLSNGQLSDLVRKILRQCARKLELRILLFGDQDCIHMLSCDRGFITYL